MKNQVSPAAAALIVVVVLGIAAFTWFRFFAGGAGVNAGEKPPGMPADVAAKFKEMGGATGPGKPGGAGGSTAPGTSGGTTAPGTTNSGSGQ